MKVEDVFTQNRRLLVRLGEKGGKPHAMPCHHNLEACTQGSKLVCCCRREHCRKCVVTPPEMVEKGGRNMQCAEAEQQESDGLVHRQELPGERTILSDQGRQLAEEEQVHSIAAGVGLQKP
jgi:hypothetical protein